MDKQNSAWCVSVDFRPPWAPWDCLQGLPPAGYPSIMHTVGAQSPLSWLLGFYNAPSKALLTPRLTFPAFPSRQVLSTPGLGRGGKEKQETNHK